MDQRIAPRLTGGLHLRVLLSGPPPVPFSGLGGSLRNDFAGVTRTTRARDPGEDRWERERLYSWSTQALMDAGSTPPLLQGYPLLHG